MGRRGSLLVVLASVATAGLILGVGVVQDPALVLPWSLEAILLLGVTAVLVRSADPDVRGWLVRLVVLGLAARVAAAFVVYGVASPEFFAPDVGTWEARGAALRRSWMGVGPEVSYGWQASYIYLNAVALELLGTSRYALPVLNLFLGIWTAMAAFHLGRECFGVRTGKVAGVLVAVFPSLVLWSVLNVRDALATAVVALCALLAVRLYRRVRLAEALVLVLALVFLSSLRDYMAVLVLGGILLGWALALRPGRALPTLALGLVLGLGGIFALERLEVLTPDVLNDPLGSMAGLRQNLQQDFFSGLAGSAYGLEYDTSTLQGALRYLPLGLAYFLFAPFPWAIESALQALTLPEVLLWYLLVPFTVVGLLRVRGSEGATGLLLVGLLALVVSSYALVEGNFGTAYRHRSQVLPIFFVFAASGIVRWWEGLEARRRIRAERRALARESARGVPASRAD